jgi:hypothetical protein
MPANGTRTLCAWLVFATATFVPGLLQAGKLGDIRHETSGSSSAAAAADDDDDDDDGPSLLGAILQAIFDGDDHDTRGSVEGSIEDSPPGPRPMYLAYPYVAAQRGSLRLVPVDRTSYLVYPPIVPGGLRRARVQVWGEGAGDWSGLYRGTLGFSAQLAGSLGFETRGSLWYEPLTGTDDQLFFWDNNLLIELTPSPELQPYLGAGLQIMLDPTGRSAGVVGGHGLLRFDVYPAEPWVLHLGTALGVLGKAFMFEGQGTIGAQLSRFELYAGYSAWTIGRTVLHGPVAGMRMTF